MHRAGVEHGDHELGSGVGMECSALDMRHINEAVLMEIGDCLDIGE